MAIVDDSNKETTEHGGLTNSVQDLKEEEAGDISTTGENAPAVDTPSLVEGNGSQQESEQLPPATSGDTGGNDFILQI